MTAITVNLPYPDARCEATMCTALEGGVGYWSQADKLVQTEAGYESCLICECDDLERFDWKKKERVRKLDADVIRRGIQRILDGTVAIRADLAAQVLRDATTAYHSWDPMDAEAADCVVQAGLFGELRYS